MGTGAGPVGAGPAGVGEGVAARTGRPGNVGTIGVAVFRERAAAPAVSRPPVARAHASPAPAAPAAVQAGPDAYASPARVPQQLGTGHGPREWSPAGQATFARASRQPAQFTQLRYDAPWALAARGIGPRDTPRAPPPRGPRAFPGGFVPDPPAW